MALGPIEMVVLEFPESRFTGEILVAASLALIVVWTVAGLAGAMASPWAASSARSAG